MGSVPPLGQLHHQKLQQRKSHESGKSRPDWQRDGLEETVEKREINGHEHQSQTGSNGDNQEGIVEKLDPVNRPPQRFESEDIEERRGGGGDKDERLDFNEFPTGIAVKIEKDAHQSQIRADADAENDEFGGA